MTIKWPAQTDTRLIPVAANSVRITITNGTNFSVSQVIARPATNTTFNDLPPGALTVSATAHADTAGTVQPPQASSTQVVNAVADDTFRLNLTLASTIDHLLLTQSAAGVSVGQTATFAVAAQDAAGNVVLTGNTTWKWTTSDAAVASLQANGASLTVTGLAAGSASITATETESGKTASLPLTVAAASPGVPTPAPTPPPASATQQAVAYQINPSHSGSISFGQALTFPASPTWSVMLGGQISYPLIAGGKVFVTTNLSTGDYGLQVYALDAATGKTVWGPIAMSGLYSWSGLAYDRGKIFVVNGNGLLRSFDAATGTAGWSRKMPGQYSFDSPPTAVNGIVYLGGAGSGGTLYAVDETNGQVLWTQEVANGNVSSPTFSTENDGVFVSYPGQVYKFEPKTGNMLWHYDAGISGGGGKTAAYANGLLYVRDYPYDYTRTKTSNMIFNANNGTYLGDVKVGTFSVNPIPALGSKAGFYMDSSSFDQGGTLQGVDLSSLHVLWSFAGDGQLSSAPILINETVIIGSASGTVYALDANTGTVVWQGAAGNTISHPDEQNASRPLTGLGAGEGYLVVPADNRLTAWRIISP